MCAFHNINKLEQMIINIQSEGEAVIWYDIETKKDAFERCKQRKLYLKAIQKISRSK